MLMKWGIMCEIVSGSRWDPVMVCCEQGNDPLGFVRGRKCLQLSSDFQEVCWCMEGASCVCAKWGSRSPGAQLSGRQRGARPSVGVIAFALFRKH